MRKLPFYHAFTAKSHEPMIDLAEMLIERAPVPMSKVFFANSGSEANDSAIKMVWYLNNALGRPKKKKIIGRLKGYHGITIGIGLADRPAGQPPQLRRAAARLHPHHDAALLSRRDPGRDPRKQFATRCADELEKLILAEGPDTVAAMWAEPIMGAGGVIVPPRGYFPKIQAVLRKYDVLLVADEVICGFWRTGNYWGSQTLDIQPDILVCAKALSSSYLPISAVMVNERVFQAPGQGKPRDRHVRPRLHLFRPSGAGRRRDRDAEDLRRDEHRRACRRGRRRICRPNCAAASPTIRWWARSAASA